MQAIFCLLEDDGVFRVHYLVGNFFAAMRRHLMLTTNFWTYEYDVWASLAFSLVLSGAKQVFDLQPRPPNLMGRTRIVGVMPANATRVPGSTGVAAASLLPHFGWRSLLLFAGVVTAVMLLANLLWLRESRTEEGYPEATPNPRNLFAASAAPPANVAALILPREITVPAAAE